MEDRTGVNVRVGPMMQANEQNVAVYVTLDPECRLILYHPYQLAIHSLNEITVFVM